MLWTKRSERAFICHLCQLWMQLIGRLTVFCLDICYGKGLVKVFDKNTLLEHFIDGKEEITLSESGWIPSVSHYTHSRRWSSWNVFLFTIQIWIFLVPFSHACLHNKFRGGLVNYSFWMNKMSKDALATAWTKVSNDLSPLLWPVEECEWDVVCSLGSAAGRLGFITMFNSYPTLCISPNTVYPNEWLFVWTGVMPPAMKLCLENMTSENQQNQVGCF